MVFASLVEYAVVSYMNKKLAQRRERRRKQAEQQMPVEMPMYSQVSPTLKAKASYQNMTLINDNYVSPGRSSMKHMDTFFGATVRNPSLSITEAMMPKCDCHTIPLIQNPRLVTDKALWPAPFVKPKRATQTCRSVTPSKIDKCSRFIFPILFFTFNYGYTTATIHYHWCQLKDENCNSAVKVEPFELPSYRFTSLCINKTIATTSSGSYSRLWAQFLFVRESAFYMVQIYVPAMLVVFISWVSFWINRESAPSRTVIGTLTVLTETHLLTGTNRRLPPVSYVKAVDVYLGFCYLIVVLALIEYAVVAYSSKKYEDRKRNKNKNIFEPKPQLPAPDLLRDARIDKCTCESDISIIAIAKQPRTCNNCCSHSRIDLTARIVFPISVSSNKLYFLRQIV
ncbi:unnamed protein product [Thelazia callipaeda]|uniref:Neur_chan_memb domain-containing protein n=1 Tax=Thelazia callipaeda TaxID=103827 RepID=A0A158RAX3_THECL|nr:unnamed protein product [Thelazia callipaeda]